MDVNVRGGNNFFANEIKSKDRRRSIVQQMVSKRKGEGKAIYHTVEIEISGFYFFSATVTPEGKHWTLSFTIRLQKRSR